MQYAVIYNPQRLIFKHEVWYGGEADVQTPSGHLVRTVVARPTKKFRTEEQAKGYIEYQQNVHNFRRKVGVTE